jgi:hypothetical protein
LKGCTEKLHHGRGFGIAGPDAVALLLDVCKIILEPFLADLAVIGIGRGNLEFLSRG